MTRRRTTRGTRPAFTMIELLIVIAIIAVLTVLLTGSVYRVVKLGQRTETASDIMKMDQSLKLAMQKYNGAQFMPSRLYLFNDMAMYTPLSPAEPNGKFQTIPAIDQPLARQTAIVLRYMFGKRLLMSNHVVNPVSPPFNQVNWGSLNGVKLCGAECLVFYLGGYTFSGQKGFSVNATDPTDGNLQRIGPFFDFKLARLISGPGGGLVYTDSYGSPFAYFGASSANVYLASDCNTNLNDLSQPNLGLDNYYRPPAQRFSVPPAAFQSGPYQESATKFMNPNSFQIIAAGPDRKFGQGGLWDPRTGTAPNDPTGYHMDNLSNFSQSELGNEQQ